MKFTQYIKNLGIIGVLMALAISSVAPMLASADIAPSLEAEALTVTCNASASTVETGQDVAWDANISGGISQSYIISMSGDDGLSGSTNVTHKAYTTAGVKTVHVTVTSDAGTAQEQLVSDLDCGSVTVTEATPAPVVSTGSSSGRSTSVTSSHSGEVLGASIGPVSTSTTTSTTTTTVACKPIINSNLRYGAVNNEQDVRNLQHFLNNLFPSSVKENGVYDIATVSIVNKFQLTYADQILKPWVDAGLLPANTPTGFVYKTTARWINLMACPTLDIPMPLIK